MQKISQKENTYQRSPLYVGECECYASGFNETIGLHTMGTHPADDTGFWYHIPNWNGPWRKYTPSSL
jgi:hypothetical protein